MFGNEVGNDVTVGETLGNEVTVGATLGNEVGNGVGETLGSEVTVGSTLGNDVQSGVGGEHVELGLSIESLKYIIVPIAGSKQHP